MSDMHNKEHRVDAELLDGVFVKELRLIPDARGFLMEILRNDDTGLYSAEELPFGQVYVTCVLPGVVKGWHAHAHQTDRMACVSGLARIVLYDDRPDSPTHGRVNEFFSGPWSPKLVVIPPGVQHGFSAVGAEPAVIVNTPTRQYDYHAPDELRLDPHDCRIPYDWGRVDR